MFSETLRIGWREKQQVTAQLLMLLSAVPRQIPKTVEKGTLTLG